MKLLIVDDEELTRTGVISSIDWTSIGIDEVLQADDGINGLEVARAKKPDIILCDVRMPRLDGIQMLERLEEAPSGYSFCFYEWLFRQGIPESSDQTKSCKLYRKAAESR